MSVAESLSRLRAIAPFAWSEIVGSGEHGLHLPGPAGLAYFVLFAGLFAYRVPALEAPDEVQHVDYANYVSRTGWIPTQARAGTGVHHEGHQPPLYYIPCAALIRTFSRDHVERIKPVGTSKPHVGQATMPVGPIFDHVAHDPFPSAGDRVLFYVLRGFSICLGALNLYLVILIARRLIPSSGWAMFAVLLVAALPQYGFVSAIINNDNAANLTSSACIYFLLTMLDEPERPRNYFLLGLCVGLAIIAKKTAWFIAPVAFVGMAYVWWSHPRARERILSLIVWAMAMTAAVSGWLFLKYRWVYGEWFGTHMEEQTLLHLVERRTLSSPYFLGSYPPHMQHTLEALLGARPSLSLLFAYFSAALLLSLAIAAVLLRLARTRAHTVPGKVGLVTLALLPAALFCRGYLPGFQAGEFVTRLSSSFVGVFGYANVYLPDLVYVFYGALVGAALAAPLVFGVRGALDRKLVFSLILIGACLAGIVHYNTTYRQPQGRYILPVASLIAVFVTLGLKNAVSRIPWLPVRYAVVAAIVCGLLWSDAVSILTIGSSYYAG